MDEITPQIPQTVDQAVEKLVKDLSFRDKTRIANMRYEDLVRLNLSFGKYLQTEYRLTPAGGNLMESCRQLTGEARIHPEQASLVIIMELWERLQQAPVLKVVK